MLALYLAYDGPSSPSNKCYWKCKSWIIQINSPPVAVQWWCLKLSQVWNNLKASVAFFFYKSLLDNSTPLLPPRPRGAGCLGLHPCQALQEEPPRKGWRDPRRRILQAKARRGEACPELLRTPRLVAPVCARDAEWGLLCEGCWELFQVDCWGSNSTVLSFVLSREAEGAVQGLGALQAVGNRDWERGLGTGTGTDLPSVLMALPLPCSV